MVFMSAAFLDAKFEFNVPAENIVHIRITKEVTYATIDMTDG
jgi:hypothetical protein